MTRANLAQVEEDLEAARARLAEAYYDWAAQLAREAASDALALVEDEQAGVSPPPGGRIGDLEARVRRLAETGVLDGELTAPARVLDEALDPTLEPDHDPGLAQREGGSVDYLEQQDTRQAVEAASRIAGACRRQLAEPDEDAGS